jgi:hypothetical protein
LDIKNVGTGWGNNEYTKQVPEPDMEVSESGESALGYSANFKDATVEQIKGYAAKVKGAGFNKQVSEMGGEFYMFNAENADGWSVLISWEEGKAGILISKP